MAAMSSITITNTSQLQEPLEPVPKVINLNKFDYNDLGEKIVITPANKTEILRLHSEIRKGSLSALITLGTLHQTQTRDFDEMHKVFLTVLKKGDKCHKAFAATSLGLHHRDTTKCVEKAIEYFLIGTQNDSDDAMYYMGCYYMSQKDFGKMEEMWLNAAVLGHCQATEKVAVHFNNIKKNPVLQALIQYIRKHDALPKGKSILETVKASYRYN
jgi:hypothetical protein